VATLSMTKYTDLSFEDSARHVARRLRRALIDVLASVGLEATGSREVARRLGLKTSLAWKTVRIVADKEPLAAIATFPGSAARRTLMKAFEAAGVGQQLLEPLQEAMADFDKLIEAHASDRERLEVMLSSLAGDKQRERDESIRKQAFLANSALWGAQARVRVGTAIVSPSADLGFVDHANVVGLVDFWRLKAGAPWHFTTFRIAVEGREPQTHRGPEPIDSAQTDPASMLLLKDFCAPDMRSLRTTPLPDGSVQYELPELPVGSRGRGSVMAAWISRGLIPRWATPEFTWSEHGVSLGTPAEVLLFDLMVHKSLPYPKPAVRVIGLRPGEPLQLVPHQSHVEFAVGEGLKDLGPWPFDLSSKDVPEYPRMMELVFSKLGLNMADFRAYRFELKYPPLSAMAICRYDVPARP